MIKVILLAGLTVLLTGCFYPTESGIVSSGWADAPFLARFRGNTKRVEPKIYCYRTLARVDCHAKPLPGQSDRLASDYTPLQKPGAEQASPRRAVRVAVRPVPVRRRDPVVRRVNYRARIPATVIAPPETTAPARAPTHAPTHAPTRAKAVMPACRMTAASLSPTARACATPKRATRARLRVPTRKPARAATRAAATPPRKPGLPRRLVQARVGGPAHDAATQ